MRNAINLESTRRTGALNTAARGALATAVAVALVALAILAPPISVAVLLVTALVLGAMECWRRMQSVARPRRARSVPFMEPITGFH